MEKVINSLAVIGNIIAFVYNIPQVYKTLKTQSATDLSMSFLILRLLSSIIWLIYSFYYKMTDVVITWLITGGSSLILIICKIIFDRKKTNILPIQLSPIHVSSSIHVSPIQES